MSPAKQLTVAVTGATGEIGIPFITALDQLGQVGRIVAMARREFDPQAQGWDKVEYRRGDVLDRATVDALVKGADVVVHLAFVIVAGNKSHEANVEGSRNVFEAAAAAGAKRIVYTSSVAAYGFDGEHGGPDSLLTEDIPVRGGDRHPYSEQKAEVEGVLDTALAGSRTAAYVFRPCIVAGPQARILIDLLPTLDLRGRLPAAIRGLFDQVPVLKPVLPDPGVPLQLVHHDDVADALCDAVLGKGTPGVYNLAAEGSITVADLAHEIGWYSVPVPDLAVDATAEIIARLPFLPDTASWIEALRHPVLMDTSRARSELKWVPAHDAADTLQAMVAAHRDDLEAATLRGG